jgi:flotillin
MTLQPRCEHVETQRGVALTVTAVAQVMVMAEDALAAEAERQNSERDNFLQKALEQFLGRRRQEMEDTILQTLEGHLRAILGTLDVEPIYKDRSVLRKGVEGQSWSSKRDFFSCPPFASSPPPPTPPFSLHPQ